MKATLSQILIFKGISENPDLLEQLINLEGLDPVRSVQDKPLIATRFEMSGKHCILCRNVLSVLFDTNESDRIPLCLDYCLCSEFLYVTAPA